MNNWYVCNLGDPMMADQSLERIRSLYHAMYHEPVASNECAVFMRHETKGRLHCEVVVYFAPGAAEIANAAGAVSCNQPAAGGLALLAGPEEIWPLLFPAVDT